MAEFYLNGRGRGGNSVQQPGMGCYGQQQPGMRNYSQQQQPGLGFYEQPCVGNSYQQPGNGSLRGRGNTGQQHWYSRGGVMYPSQQPAVVNTAPQYAVWDYVPQPVYTGSQPLYTAPQLVVSYPVQQPPAGYSVQQPPVVSTGQLLAVANSVQQSSGGYSVQQPAMGNSSQQSGMGYPGQQPAVGNSSQQSGMGYPGQQPAVGNSSQQSGMGYPGQQPAVGNSSQQSGMGYPGQQPAVGNSSQQSWMGYPGQQPAMGNSSQQSGMGYPGQQPVMGNSSQQSGMGYPGQQMAVGNSGQQQINGWGDTGSRLQQRVNERGIEETYVSGVHMTVGQLKAERSCFEKNQYFGKQVAAANEMTEDKEIVPHYPRPVEFHVSRIAHVTTEEGMNTVMSLMGFRGKSSANVWWDSAIGPEEVGGAEQRYLDKVFPDRTEEEKRRKMPFLRKFTTSPVFKDGSRYGNFRFTLPLKEVLEAYRSQFCGEKEPILRVWKTVVYKQEIMYSVMVHSPDVHCYDNFPILGDNEEGMCAYRNGEIIWRAQAISETHEFRLKTRHDRRQVSAQRVNEKVFYVWDHVTLAFDIPEGNLLSFPREKLIGSLTACDIEEPKLISNNQVVDYYEAMRIVEEIKNRERVEFNKSIGRARFIGRDILP